MRKAPPISRTLFAAALVALVSCQLVLAASSHHPAAHAGGDDHACVICVFSAAHEVGQPVLGEILPPLSTRTAAPEATSAPRVTVDVTVHRARAPPARHA